MRSPACTWRCPATPGTLRTGSRGCCTVEDAFDARRVCDLLGIPYYVWDFSEDFLEDVVADFLSEYAAGRTPNPCLRCNEKIKFAALLDRAIALGFDAVATGHHVRLMDGILHRVGRRGQGPVLRAGRAHRGAVGAQHVPARRADQAAGPGGGARGAVSRSRPSRTRTTSASSRTATPTATWSTSWAPEPVRSSTPSPARCSPSTTGSSPTPIGQRKGLQAGATRARRPPPVRAGHRAGHRHGDRRPGERAWTSAW